MKKLTPQHILQSLLALALATSPFVMMSMTSEMFEIPKIIWIFQVTLMATIVLSLAMTKRLVTLKITKLHVIWGGFLILNIASTFTSLDPQMSLNGYYGRINGGVYSLVYWGLLLLVASQIESERFRKIFVAATFAVAIILLLLSLPGRFLRFDTLCLYFRGEYIKSCWSNDFRPELRSFSTLGQPNWLATYYVFAFGLGLSRWADSVTKPRNTKHFITYATLLAVLGYGIYTTGSRSGLLAAAVVSVFYFSLVVTESWRRSYKIAFYAIFTLVFIAATTIYSARNIHAKFDRNVTDSGFIRSLLWSGAVRSIIDHPVLGTGPETFALNYQKYKHPLHIETSEREFIYNKAHNEVLNIASNVGLPALIMYLIFMTVAVVDMCRNRRYGEASAIIGVFTCNFFGFATSVTQLLTFVTIGLYAKNSSLSYATPPIPNLIRNIALATGIAICVIAIYSNHRFLIADMYFEAGNMARSDDRDLEATSHYSMALTTRFHTTYMQKLSESAALSAYALHSSSTDDASTGMKHQKHLDVYLTLAKKLTPLLVPSSPHNPSMYKSTARNYYVLSKIEPDQKKKYDQMIRATMSKARAIAPLDLTLVELENGFKD